MSRIVGVADGGGQTRGTEWGTDDAERSSAARRGAARRGAVRCGAVTDLTRDN